MKNNETLIPKKITVLFFPFNLLSHYLRSLVLADSYDKNLYNILFLSSENYNVFVQQHHYQTFSCLQFDQEYVMQCAERFEFTWLKQADLERIMRAQAAVIKSFQSEIVIGDMAPTLKMAAELCGVKYFSILNGYMTRYYALTRKIPGTHKASGIFNALPEPVANWLTRIGEKVTMRKIHKPFKLIRNKYKLQHKYDYLSEMEGDHNLICDLPHLFPQKSLPVNYAHIGPLIYLPKTGNDQWLDKIELQKPLILVSMGSTGDWSRLNFLNQDFYSRYTIVTAGDKEKILDAPHIISRPFVNIMEVLKKADLMICHGGNGTINYGILCRVYMLCISSHFEQEWNIAALEKNKYGKSANHFNELNWKSAILLNTP